MRLTVRAAVEADAEALGLIHVRAWQSAYSGQMPDEYLDSLSVPERSAMWRRSVTESPEQHRLWVIEVDGDVVGFAVFGPERNPQSPGHGELYAINLDPDAWGHGTGRVLLRAATDELATDYDEAVLWVLPGNSRARALYESEGWVADGGTQTDTLFGVTVTEIRYRRHLGNRHDSAELFGRHDG